AHRAERDRIRLLLGGRRRAAARGLLVSLDALEAAIGHLGDGMYSGIGIHPDPGRQRADAAGRSERDRRRQGGRVLVDHERDRLHLSFLPGRQETANGYRNDSGILGTVWRIESQHGAAISNRAVLEYLRGKRRPRVIFRPHLGSRLGPHLSHRVPSGGAEHDRCEYRLPTRQRMACSHGCDTFLALVPRLARFVPLRGPGSGVYLTLWRGAARARRMFSFGTGLDRPVRANDLVKTNWLKTKGDPHGLDTSE